MKISRTVTEKYISNDCEARTWEWVYTEESYEELSKRFATECNAWYDAVALVEETFDSETFKITSKTLKETKKKYDTSGFFRKCVGVEEIIYEEKE